MYIIIKHILHFIHVYVHVYVPGHCYLPTYNYYEYSQVGPSYWPAVYSAKAIHVHVPTINTYRSHDSHCELSILD